MTALTLIEEVNAKVSEFPPLSLTTSAALKTAPSGETPGLNAMVSSALLSQMAVLVANSTIPGIKDAVSNGVGVAYQSNQSGKFIIGNMALTPNQLEKAGIIKVGSASYVDHLLSRALASLPTLQAAAEEKVRLTPYTTQEDIDKARTEAASVALSPEKIIPDNLFFKDNLHALVSSNEAQISVMTSNLNQAALALVQSGAITGEESATTIAGLILAVTAAGSTMEDGLIQTLSTISRLATNQPVFNMPKNNPGLFGTPTELMSVGLSAANQGISSTVIGPLLAYLTNLGLVGDPQQLMNQAVMSKFPDLPSYTPVNLKSSINSSPYKDIPWTTMTPL